MSLKNIVFFDWFWSIENHKGLVTIRSYYSCWKPRRCITFSSGEPQLPVRAAAHRPRAGCHGCRGGGCIWGPPRARWGIRASQTLDICHAHWQLGTEIFVYSSLLKVLSHRLRQSACNELECVAHYIAKVRVVGWDMSTCASTHIFQVFVFYPILVWNPVNLKRFWTPLL